MSAHAKALAIAVRHHQAGELQPAEQIYRQVLQADPNYADALNGLGMIASQFGQHEDAIDLISRAIKQKRNIAAYHNNLAGAYLALRRLPEAVSSYRRALVLSPDFAEAHSNLGNALKDQGKVDEAIACYRQASLLKPGFAEAHSNLGNALWDQGKFDEAVASCRRALALKPDLADAHNNLGNGLKGLGKLDEAIAAYRQAIHLNPNLADAHSNLGEALREQGMPDDALACCHRALELKPDLAEAHSSLANVFRGQGQLQEAVASYLRALELKPHSVEVHSNLADALWEQGKREDAVACFRRAIELKPEFADAHCNLGNALWQMGQLDEAITGCRRALELRPNYAEAYNNLGNVYKDQGKLDEAIASYRKAVECKPSFVCAYSNLLFTLQYFDEASLASLQSAHAEFDRQFAAPLRDEPAQRSTTERRSDRIRLGFVSPDLYRHPVGFFLIRILENLPKDQFDVVCYHDRIQKDDLTQTFQAAASEWHDVFGLGDKRLADQIRADQIDILFDMAGHTGHNRLLVFARKPAPIQITWLGYVGTTGLKEMDYILADRHLIPPEAEPYYCEKILRMPDDYACYSEPDDVPEPVSLPALEKGYFTFGSLNNLTKITPHVVQVWARILHRVPQSRLVIRYRGLDDPTTRKRFVDQFAQEGIASDRLNLIGWCPPATRMHLYHEIDLGLDPFPYSGATTTCDALWMGVPVVSCPLETFASRQSLTHLNTVGLTETVASNLDEYVEIAVSLANDLPRLERLRSGLRERMAASPLCDGKRFATQLSSILRNVWDQHRNQASS